MHGTHQVRLENGIIRIFSLHRNLLQLLSRTQELNIPGGDIIKTQLTEISLFLYVYYHLKHRQINETQRQAIVESLEQSGFPRLITSQALDLNQNGELRDLIYAWIEGQASDGRPIGQIITDVQLQTDWLHQRGEWEQAVSLADQTADIPLAHTRASRAESSTASDLLNVIQSITEEQNRREACR